MLRHISHAIYHPLYPQFKVGQPRLKDDMAYNGSLLSVLRQKLCAHELVKLDFVTLSIKRPKQMQDNVGSLLWRCQLKSEQCKGIIYPHYTSPQDSQ